jgi:hypothetical protein
MHRGRGGERARAAAVRHHQQRMAARQGSDMGGEKMEGQLFNNAAHSSTYYSDVDGAADDAADLASPVLSVGDNFYTILQVEHDASQDDIKRSFRKLALLFHPDKNINGDQQIEMQVPAPHLYFFLILFLPM